MLYPPNWDTFESERRATDNYLGTGYTRTNPIRCKTYFHHPMSIINLCRSLQSGTIITLQIYIRFQWLETNVSLLYGNGPNQNNKMLS